MMHHSVTSTGVSSTATLPNVKAELKGEPPTKYHVEYDIPEPRASTTKPFYVEKAERPETQLEPTLLNDNIPTGAFDEPMMSKVWRYSNDKLAAFGFLCILLFCAETTLSAATRHLGRGASLWTALYGRDYASNICGQSAAVGEREGYQPHLYYPADPTFGMNKPRIVQEKPVCVRRCPNENDVKTHRTVGIPMNISSTDSHGSTIDFKFKLQSPVYASAPSLELSANYLCEPLNANLREQVRIARQKSWSSFFRHSITAPFLRSFLGPALWLSVVMFFVAITVTIAQKFFPSAIPSAFALALTVSQFAWGIWGMAPNNLGLLGGLALIVSGLITAALAIYLRDLHYTGIRVAEQVSFLFDPYMQVNVVPAMLSFVTLLYGAFSAVCFVFVVESDHADHRHTSTLLKGLVWILGLLWGFEVLLQICKHTAVNFAKGYYFCERGKEQLIRELPPDVLLQALLTSITRDFGSICAQALPNIFARIFSLLLHGFVGRYALFNGSAPLFFDEMAISAQETRFRMQAAVVGENLASFSAPETLAEIAHSRRGASEARFMARRTAQNPCDPAAALVGSTRLLRSVVTAAFGFLGATIAFCSASSSVLPSKVFLGAFVGVFVGYVCAPFQCFRASLEDTVIYCFLLERRMQMEDFMEKHNRRPVGMTEYGELEPSTASDIHASLCAPGILKSLLLDNLQQITAEIQDCEKEVLHSRFVGGSGQTLSHPNAVAYKGL